MKTISLLDKKLPLVVLAGLLITAGAGAAAGVTFSGTIQGEATSKVDQALIITSLDAPNTQTNNDLGKVSDDGTKFEFSADVNQGDLYNLNTILDNKGNQDLNGQLTLKIPEPLQVEVRAKDNIEAARTDMSMWNFNIEAGELVTENTNNNQSTYTTAQPVADRNDDGSVDADDITFSDGGDGDGIGSVELNADGTLTISVDNSGDGKFNGNDEISYETGANLAIVVAIPDDAQPGFYTIKGEIKPTEV